MFRSEPPFEDFLGILLAQLNHLRHLVDEDFLQIVIGSNAIKNLIKIELYIYRLGLATVLPSTEKRAE